MKNILLLEDDALLAASVVDELEEAGYGVTWVQESDEAAEAAWDDPFSLYLFDVNVPGISGFELLASLRESGDRTPALFMTSRNQVDDIRAGFSAGADDYIKKPFDPEELLVRIEAKLPADGRVALSKTFSVDPTNFSITCGTRNETLPAKEFALLEFFVGRPAQLIAPEAIIDELYPENPISIATFRTYIKNLKRHVEGCAVIENVKGVGYRFKLL
jgi:DNA-binding response OmpR family regulator